MTRCRRALVLIAAVCAAVCALSAASAAPSLVSRIVLTEVRQAPGAAPRLAMSITTERYGVAGDRRWIALRTAYRAAPLGGWRIVGLKVWHTYAPGLAFNNGAPGGYPDVTDECLTTEGGDQLPFGGAVLPPIGGATYCPGLHFVVESRQMTGQATAGTRDDVVRFAVQGYAVGDGVPSGATIADEVESIARAPRGVRPAGTTRVRVRIERHSECVERVVFHDARRDGTLRARRERPGSRWRVVDCATPF